MRTNELTEITLKFLNVLEHINWIVEYKDWYVLKFWWNEYLFKTKWLLIYALRSLELEMHKEKVVID